MKYREEIDGLRAIAVLPVIFFHAGFESFSGGYIGVDVFFVISGYLITSIILAEKEDKTFTIVGFYERRARRILPALFLVMLACIPFAWFWMLPDYLENFGQSLVATVFFSNNILLWLTSGYFALESEFKPLIHTWSLGVEEQYYIVFPLFLILLWRLGSLWQLISFLAVGALSLVLAQWAISNSPEASFYLLPTRSWELLLGAISALMLSSNHAFIRMGRSSAKLAELLTIMGLLLIGYSIFAYNRNTPFPGVHALVPAIGSVLIIIFSTNETIIGRILGYKVVVFLGLLSYSAYLWHQPLFAFARLRSLAEPADFVFFVLAILSFLLAYVSWRYVETPFRNRATFGRRFVFSSAAFVGLFIATIGFIFHINSGFVHLRSELNTDIKSAGRQLNAAYNQQVFRFKNVKFNDDAKLNVLVVGNSFARDFINTGMENGYFDNSEVSYDDYVPNCLAGKDIIPLYLKELISQSDYFIFGSPSVALKCWQADFSILKEMGAKNIIVIGPKNFGWNMNAVMLLDDANKYRYRAKVLDEVLAANDLLSATIPPEHFVNLLHTIVDDDGRVAVFTEDRKIISQDRNHLTRDGAKFIGKKLFEHPHLRYFKYGFR